MKPEQILLGVTGGVAAYKAADLVRQLRKVGYPVRVVMTAGAEAFVTALTFQALSGHPVRTSLLDENAEAGMGHIELARWADRVLIAPASADCMAKLAAGLAGDLLTTVCLATEAPIILAPAMNQAMWRNRRTQANARRLEEDPQFSLWGPGEGDQACGDSGPGRMLEPLDLVARLMALTADSGTPGAGVGGSVADSPAGSLTAALAGERVVITAGPTREAIDPVRYISNHSSGRMGYALAAAAQGMGAEVVLVSGPTQLETPAGCQQIDVVSAEQMRAATLTAVTQGCTLFIATAAVADYRPRSPAPQKIKKTASDALIELTPNPDILAEIAGLPQAPFSVGFAAETCDLERYARDKLARKKLAMVVANDVSDSRIGFNSDNNAVTAFWPEGQQVFPCQPKHILARDLLELIVNRWQQVKQPR